MPEPSSDQTPFEDWMNLLEKTMRENQYTEASRKHKSMDKEDPLITYINQLWKVNPYSKLLPVNPGEMTNALQHIWLDAITNPDRALTSYNDYIREYAKLMTTATLKFSGQGELIKPAVIPDKGDRRFSAPDWQQNAIFDAIKQSYLLAATTLLKRASEVERLDEKQQHKLVFYIRQFLDAISPTNYTFTNPQVIHEVIQTGGQNLASGLEHLLRDLQTGEMKMTNTDAFAPGRNLAITPGQVIYRNKLIELIQYSPSTKTVFVTPLLFVPPWINKYYILDMQPHNSLIKFLVDHGYTVFVISWKNPDSSMADFTFEDYMTLGPLSALDVVKMITGSPKVNTVGYCIGGTLLSMVLSYLSAKQDETVNAAAFFVSLLDFKEVGDTEVFVDEPQLNYMEEKMMERGYLDNRSMASMFNMLRANDLIWSNVVNNYLLGKDPPAFDLLYWNADGTRMAAAAHSYYMRNTYYENNLIKPKKLILKGVPIDLSLIHQDIYAVGAQQDHIVPWKSAWRIAQFVSGSVRFVLGASGHIAGVINPPGKGKGYWINDKPVENADQWFESAIQREGSWWLDWLDWLKIRSGRQVVPPSMDSKKYAPITPAPGTYVLES
jgi:polyhydroxyalkanoate synthase subunit PhaC